MKKNRVVVTGVGVLAANGIGKDAFWSSLLAGESGIGPITLCNVDNLSSRIAGEVSGFDPNEFLQGKIKAKRLTRNTQLGLSASLLALRDAELEKETLLKSPAPLAITFGISMGGFDFIENEIRRIVAKGNQAMMPSVIGCTHIATTSTVADFIGVPCQINTITNSCIGGVDAIASAFKQIRDGRVDVALAGGSDAPVETSLVAGFCAARMLCMQNDKPQKASRPFDLHRDRGVLAEGSGMVVLENLEHALERGARPYAEIIGHGTACDPTPESGSGLRDSMEHALANACLRTEEIDFISAHGPSDIEIDQVEARMISEVFGGHAYRIPVSSIKGATGNPLAAGGAMQTVACSLGVYHGLVPPTANYEVPDPACPLDHVPGEARKTSIRHALINSHGIGRVNSSLVLKKTDAP